MHFDGFISGTLCDINYVRIISTRIDSFQVKIKWVLEMEHAATLHVFPMTVFLGSL